MFHGVVHNEVTNQSNHNSELSKDPISNGLSDDQSNGRPSVTLTDVDEENPANGFNHQLNGESGVQQHLANGHSTETNGDSTGTQIPGNPFLFPRLLLYSASDARGPARQSELDSQYLASIADEQIPNVLDDFIYTRNCRRSRLAWKSYAVANSFSDLKNLKDHISQAERSTNEELNLGFVFTGQGAQWPGMGKKLFNYAAFKESVRLSEESLRKLGCYWNLRGRVNSIIQLGGVC
jgi:hypothetical protein